MDIEASILKMDFLGIPKGVGLDLVLACIDEFDAGRMDMRRALLNFHRINEVLEAHGEQGEWSAVFKNDRVTSWIRAHEAEILEARKGLVLPPSRPRRMPDPAEIIKNRRKLLSS